jgi:flagellar hook capping protein FlgD/dockerin type I repeat protein
MTPRATRKSPPFGRSPLRIAAVALAILAGTIVARDAKAVLLPITTKPAFPTVCDTTGLVVAGVMRDPCYHVIGTKIEGPTELPTAGPIPTYEIKVWITVQEPNPLLDIACPTVTQPYEYTFWLDQVSFGRYFVRAVEYLVPFSADNTAAPKDSSVVNSTFDVRPSCSPPGCFMLSFAPQVPMRVGPCDATTPPGGVACFDVALTNETAVAGIQTEIVVSEPGADPPSPSTRFRPISVELTRPGPPTGFQVAWTADGSRAKIIVFTTGHETILPGETHILRVCYAVGPDTPDGRYPMRFENTIVADPDGGEVTPCPTFAEVVGTICVAKAGGCDLNGDGASDILDVVQLVHCALAFPGGEDACPDSVKARADCNGDGLVNIRDVICCVRKILEGGGFGAGGGQPPGSTGSTGIGFTGPARWINLSEGRATIEIVPGIDFAGIQFGIDGSGSNARIRDVTFPTLPTGYQLETSVDPDGGFARVMLYRTISVAVSSGGATFAAVPPIRLEAILEPVAGSTGGGELELVGARSANQAAQAMATRTTAPTAEVPQSPMGAPSMSVPAPNPFAVGTEVAYTLPSPQHVTLRVYSVSGRLIRTLVDAAMPAGVQRAQWDGRDSAGREVRSGIYFFKFTAGDVERTARVMRLQ